MKRRDNSLIKIIGIVLTVAIVSTFLVLAIISDKSDEESYRILDTVTYNDSTYIENDSADTVLIVGLDSYDQESSESYTNTELADFVLLVEINNETKEITPVHINRDSMVEYDVLGVKGDIVGTEVGQIALSHSYGDGGLDSLINTKNCVSNLFKGIDIDYYVQVSMDSVAIVNDDLGGIEVYVEDDFSSVDPSLTINEYHVLQGEQALTYVRTRASLPDSTNLTRMKRQREYFRNLFTAFINQSKDDDDLAIDIFEDIGDSMVSNATNTELQDLLTKAQDYKLNDSVVLEGEAIKGETYMEYYIDEDNLMKIVTSIFMKEID